MSQVCCVEGCMIKNHAKGYCAKHYHRLVRYGDALYIPPRSRLLTEKECSINGCTKKPLGKRMCNRHYRSHVKYGDPLFVDNNARIKKNGRDAEYRIYYAMIQRCNNKKNIAYKNYGYRGISVCKEWLESFNNFYRDMGEKPYGCEIDRINNNGNYEKNNCRWATKILNRRNKRNVKLSLEKAINIRAKYRNGKKINILAKIYNVHRTTINQIINNKIWKEE